MDKKEILSKAQKESDEMENNILEKSLGISTIIIPLLCLFFLIIRMIHNNYMVSDLAIMALSQILIQEVYQYLKLKIKRWSYLS